jgi:protein TonB
MVLAGVRRDKITAAVASALMEGLILYALLIAVRVVPPVPVDEALKVFTVVPPPPPVQPPPPPPAQVQPQMKLKEGAASPANIRSKATDIAAPKVPPMLPPPLPAAEMPKLDYDATSGSADIRGPGTGSGGIGQGTGSGYGGNGPGGGGMGAAPPRHIKGWLHNSDYPREAKEAGMEGTLTIIVTIEPNGRVSNCAVVRSSGSGILDEATCRLVQERYRYRPALDPMGRPVRAREIQNHSWIMQYDRQGG